MKQNGICFVCVSVNMKLTSPFEPDLLDVPATFCELLPRGSCCFSISFPLASPCPSYKMLGHKYRERLDRQVTDIYTLSVVLLAAASVSFCFSFLCVWQGWNKTSKYLALLWGQVLNVLMNPYIFALCSGLLRDSLLPLDALTSCWPSLFSRSSTLCSKLVISSSAWATSCRSFFNCKKKTCLLQVRYVLCNQHKLLGKNKKKSNLYISYFWNRLVPFWHVQSYFQSCFLVSLLLQLLL